MAQEGGADLVRRDAASVVRDPHIGGTAPADLHRDGGGTGIDGVFHQLLDDGTGTLHHLAGGDHVGQLGGQLFDFGHAQHSFALAVSS
jgi:hypothetical protein